MSRTATKTATTNFDCTLCGGVIEKGWSYRKNSLGRPHHFNAAHGPACHDPRDCVACLKPGRVMRGPNFGIA
jgi:hypothetical protein